MPYDWLEDADKELRAIAKQHARDYEIQELDRELGLTEPETGRGVLVAAQADLKSRGINPEDATEAQMVDALLRVSP
jgi:hypothetical protein